jgi:hypothetical protein
MTTEDYSSWHEACPSPISYSLGHCYICEKEEMLCFMEEKDGKYHCKMCAALPPYSDSLYNGILAFQRLFRAYYESKKKPCANCGNLSLSLHEFCADMGPICSFCVEEEVEQMRTHYEENNTCDYCNMDPCRCQEDQGPCEDCGNPWECVCLELAEDAALKRHRRVCGDKRCDGTCGTLSCGCVDVCKDHCNEEW